MALSKSITTVHGLAISGAYHRVEGIELTSKSSMRFALRAYADPGMAAVADMAFSAPYDIEGANPIRQAYMHIKAMEGFADAVDC